jgi:DNA-binding transcriptional regulator LsrR (DeoR family)
VTEAEPSRRLWAKSQWHSIGLPMSDIADTQVRKLDLAARAAWLYYIAGATQDEIANQFDISRQSAQRLIALAVSERLIEFRIQAPVAECAALVHELRARYDLSICEVVPSGPSDPSAMVGLAAAQIFETQIAQRGSNVFGFSTGRTLLRMAREISSRSRPDLKLVSIVGNAARDGCVSPYEIAMRLSDKIGAKCYPLQIPVVAATPEQCAMLQRQPSYATIKALAESARAIYVGTSDINWGSALQADGFIDEAEMGLLIDDGAVGEIAAWPFDRDGKLLANPFTERLGGFRPDHLARIVPVVGVAHGIRKVPALRAALKGGLLTGLITDEQTALAILGQASRQALPLR